jgi:hypothetical protein
VTFKDMLHYLSTGGPSPTGLQNTAGTKYVVSVMHLSPPYPRRCVGPVYHNTVCLGRNVMHLSSTHTGKRFGRRLSSSIAIGGWSSSLVFLLAENIAGTYYRQRCRSTTLPVVYYLGESTLPP